MADIKPLDQVSKKWRDVTPQRVDEYEQGVRTPRRSWAEATSDAAESYAEGVQEAISNNRFERGVSEAGDSKWRDGAINKGVSRWPQGVRQGEDAYRQGFSPFHSVIAGTSLPPRGPKGDPRNYERVKVIGDALHRAKTGS